MSTFVNSNTTGVAVMVIFVSGFSNVTLSSSDAANTRVAAGGDGVAWDTYSPQNITIE